MKIVDKFILTVGSKENAYTLKKDIKQDLDIIVNLNKIVNKNNKSIFKSEFDKLWIHGLVHLFGYNHKRDKDFNNMIRIEKKFLSYLN